MIQKLRTQQGTVLYLLDNNAGDTALGISVDVPDTDLHILQVRCGKGMMFCGIFDKNVLSALHIPAAVFSAPWFDDMMERRPVFLTAEALHIGASPEMTGAELLTVFSEDC